MVRACLVRAAQQTYRAVLAPVGSIPSDWNQAGNLPLLSTLRLASNKLSNLPANWGSGGCEGVRRLTLDNNAFKGSLPGGLAFSSLEELTLHDNQFNGELGADVKSI